MARIPLILAALLFVASLSCTKKEAAPPPPPTEETPEVAAAEPEDTTELGKFKKKKKKKKHKHKKVKAGAMPSREDGLAALADANDYLEEADFREAEKALRIASAAGTEGSDALLIRVRAELSAEKVMIAAQKKLADDDLAGARAELTKIPGGLALSELSAQLTAQIDQREEAAQKQMVERAQKRFAANDGGEEGEPPDAAAEPEKADKPAEPENKPAEPPAEPEKKAE